MSVNLNVVSVEVNSTALGPGTSTDNLTVNAAVNARTTATFSAYTGEDASSKSQTVFSETAAKLMGKCQTAAFSVRDAPDTTLTVKVTHKPSGEKGDKGSSTSLEMQGYLTSPTFLLDTLSVRPGFAMVDRGAILANLRLDIYQTSSPRSNANDPLSSGLHSVSKRVTSPNLATRFKELTERLIDYWQRNKSNSNQTAGNKLKEERHQLNLKGPLAAWYDLLDNSTSMMNFACLEKLATQEPANVAFNTEILSILRGVSRDFQEILSSLCATFQLMQIPAKDGGPGRLARIYDLMTGKEEPLTLPATSILLNGDSFHDLLPLQQVLVTGVPRAGVHVLPSYYMANQLDAGNYLVGGWPKSQVSASGDVAIVPLPSYMNDIAAALGTEKEGASPPADDKLQAMRTRVSDLAKAFLNDTVDKMVEDYARTLYFDMAFGGTSVSISVPADLSLWPGQRYAVRNPQGEPLFVGFLSGVQHGFNRGAEGGHAGTTCNFTHILFAGFTPPA